MWSNGTIKAKAVQVISWGENNCNHP
jgi:hypothetical protein